MIDIINYIVAHPLYCLALGFLVIVAWNIAGFNSTATNNKRSALIDKHYRKKFQKNKFKGLYAPLRQQRLKHDCSKKLILPFFIS